MRNGDIFPYFVTRDGDVINSVTERVLKQKTTKAGYRAVCLYLIEGKKSKFVHRLLAQRFLPNPLALPEINHIDGIKDNNDLTNLEWCTRKENALHAHRTGLQIATKLFLSANGRYKGVITATRKSDGNVIFINALTGCESHGFNRGHVSSCINGGLKHHKGYTFSRGDE